MALLIAVLFCCVDAPAQIRDSLREVRVRTKRQARNSNDDRINTFSPGQKLVHIDSLVLQQYQFQSIGDMLSQQVPVFVKSYGFNNLATLNFRGASAAQSQVYWNGVPLQNAALGVSDVSLLPVSLMSKVNVVYGSSAALWGSGNVGGALLVETDKPAFDTAGSAEYSASVAAGSFGQYHIGLGAQARMRKLSLGIKAFGQSAQNNFSYTDNGSRLQTLNSRLQSGALMGNAGYRVNDKNTLGFTGWYQQYYREIPRAMFEPQSVKNQRDESMRLLLDWNRDTKQHSRYAKLAYTRDRMLYDDAQITLRSDNITNMLYGEVGNKVHLNPNHKLLVFVPVTVAWIDRRTAGDVKTQNRAALAGAYAGTFLRQKLNVSISARGEVINDKSIFLPGVNAGYDATQWLSFRANVQRSYRAPTLNELHYNPGGNDKLLPERGWNQDAGYALKIGSKRALTFTHDASVFNRNIKDWIVWFGGAIWTPHNIAMVHSRGMETDNNLQWRIDDKWKLHLGFNSSYIIATTEESYIPGDNSIGKQIPYTPRYNYRGNIGFNYKAFYFNYNHTYTGYRFITVDESQYLLPYNTGNLQLLYTHQLPTTTLQLSGQCNNITNNQYAVVNGRPMPGINWMLGAKFIFNN
jgi:Outer membrane cobalamin receptor protein